MTRMKRNIRNQSPHKVETMRMTVGFVVYTRMCVVTGRSWRSPVTGLSHPMQGEGTFERILGDTYHRK